jgi:hypothetical protein
MIRPLLALLILAAVARLTEAQTPSCPSACARVAWRAPGENLDGSAYANPGGYRVLWGRAPTELTETVYVSGPTVLTWQVGPLAPGTWYFAVKAVSTAGIESPLSNIGTKTIRAPAPTDGAIEAPTDGSIEPGDAE